MDGLADNARLGSSSRRHSNPYRVGLGVGLLVRRILECSVSLATHIPQLLREMVDARQVSAATNSLKSLQGFPFYNKPMRQQAQSKRL